MPDGRAGASAAGACDAPRGGAGSVLGGRLGGAAVGTAIARTALLVDVLGSLAVAGGDMAAGELAGTRNVRRVPRGGGGAVGSSVRRMPLCWAGV